MGVQTLNEFATGLPGRMKSGRTLLRAAQAAKALGMNSELVSRVSATLHAPRRWLGTRRRPSDPGDYHHEFSF